MKGGTTTRYAIVNVGAHSRFRIDGRVTLGGVGMPGVLVKTNARQAYTDADGFYTLAGLDAAAPPLTVIREGYTFTGNTDFIATAGILLSISAPLPNAAEGGAPGRFTLTRTGSTSIPLTVQLQTISGTATKTTDYTLTPDVAANTFTIPAGQASLNIDLAPVDDGIAEGPETATIQLVPSPAYVIGGIGEATVTINDDDTALPLVSIAATLAHTIENDPAPAQFTVTRASSTASALAVNYTISGTAVNGADYLALSGSITIPSSAASANIPVLTIDDALNEGSETVTLTLSSDAAYLIGTSAATATIVDDDQQIITVTAADANAAEVSTGPPNPGTFRITARGGHGSAIAVNYTMSGTATNGIDYSALTGTTIIPAGNGTRTVDVVVAPTQEAIAEPLETIALTFAPGIGYTFWPQNSTATIWLRDGAAPTVFADAHGYEPGEGALTSSFRLTRAGSTSGALDVNFTITGTATNGADYAAIPLTATIPDDALAEGTETIVLTLTPGAYSASPVPAVLRLFDSESPVPVVQFATGTESVRENAGFVNIPVTLSGTIECGNRRVFHRRRHGIRRERGLFLRWRNAHDSARRNASHHSAHHHRRRCP